MNKKEFIDAVHTHMCQQSGYQRVAAERAVEGMIKVITGELTHGGEVVITGFGKFEAKVAAAREGRNPKTGAPLQIKAKKRVRFVPGKLLKEAVNS